MAKRHTDYIRRRLAVDPQFKKQRAATHTRCRKNLREFVIKKYGGICKCCGEPLMEFLCIDHKNGGGNKERACTSSYSLLYKLKREPVSSDYQVLCHNCNFAKWAYGECPHGEK